MKDRIIICARDTFLKTGYNGFSMRKVANCAEISATAIYRHFKNKEELLFNVLLTGFREFSRYLKRCEVEKTAIDRLLRSSKEYINFALDHAAYYEMMFVSTEQMTGLKDLNQNGADEMQATYLYHWQLVDDCNFENQNTDQLALALWASCHGFASLYLAGKLPLEKNDFLKIYHTQMENMISNM